MGEVFRSRDRLTEEIVALKRALPEPVPPGQVPTAEAVSVETHPRQVETPTPTRHAPLPIAASRQSICR